MWAGTVGRVLWVGTVAGVVWAGTVGGTSRSPAIKEGMRIVREESSTFKDTVLGGGLAMGGAEDEDDEEDEDDDDDKEENEGGTGAGSAEEGAAITLLGGRMACLGGGCDSLVEVLAGLGSGTNCTPTDPFRVLVSSSPDVYRSSVLLWRASDTGRTFSPLSDMLFERTGLMSISDCGRVNFPSDTCFAGSGLLTSLLPFSSRLSRSSLLSLSSLLSICSFRSRSSTLSGSSRLSCSSFLSRGCFLSLLSLQSFSSRFSLSFLLSFSRSSLPCQFSLSGLLSCLSRSSLRSPLTSLSSFLSRRSFSRFAFSSLSSRRYRPSSCPGLSNGNDPVRFS